MALVLSTAPEGDSALAARGSGTPELSCGGILEGSRTPVKSPSDVNCALVPEKSL